MTKNRKQIYESILSATGPLNSAQVYKQTGSQMDLATIYRGLKYLEDKNLITSFVFACEDRVMERYYTKADADHLHYMHCRKCHNFFPMPYCPMKVCEGQSGDLGGFLVENHSITLIGLCEACQ